MMLITEVIANDRRSHARMSDSKPEELVSSTKNGVNSFYGIHK